MIEQQVANRFRDAVAGEPPLGFDPDAVIDREIKRTRRRRVVLAVAGATMVEAVAVWALVSTPGAGSDQVQPGGNDTPSASGVASGAPAPEAEVRLTSFEEVLSLGNPLAHAPDGASLSVTDLLARNPDGDQGTVQLKRADQVIFDVSLENFRDYDMHFTQPVTADPGVPVTLAVSCTTSVRNCQNVSVTVSGYTVLLER